MSNRTAQRHPIRKVWQSWPIALRTLIVAIGWIVVLSAISVGVTVLLGHSSWVNTYFVTFVAGVAIVRSMIIQMRLRELERMIRQGVINELVAQLSDGRSIWIKDDAHTYEAPAKDPVTPW